MTKIADVLWLIAGIGAINWGLVGLFNINLIDRLLADRPTRIAYVLIGLCGVAVLFLLPMMRAKSTTGTPVLHRGMR